MDRNGTKSPFWVQLEDTFAYSLLDEMGHYAKPPTVLNWTAVATDKMIHGELTEAIIGASMKVLNTLRPGLNEKAYENALVIELRKRGHRIEQQKRFDVIYEGQVVDTLVPDLLVDDAVMADPKVVEDFTPTHLSQMIGYLAIPQLRLALLLNFKHGEQKWRRIVR